MRFKTNGGVLKPAEPILDIVPAEDTLLIDARVSPVDIDVVRVGLQAKVELTAYSGRSMPRVNEIVKTVSADRIVDEGSRQPYYLARVHVDREEIHQLHAGIELNSRDARRGADRDRRANHGRISVPAILGCAVAKLQGDVKMDRTHDVHVETANTKIPSNSPCGCHSSDFTFAVRSFVLVSIRPPKRIVGRPSADDLQ